jgi:hypothetical protein
MVIFNSYVKLLEGMLIIQRNIWLGAGWCHLFGQTLLCWAAPWQCLSIRAKSHTSDLGESRPSKCGVTRLSIWNQLQKPFGIRIYHNIIIPYHIISYYIISNSIMWYYIILWHIISYYYHLISDCSISSHIISYHIIS